MVMRRERAGREGGLVTATRVSLETPIECGNACDVIARDFTMSFKRVTIEKKTK